MDFRIEGNTVTFWLNIKPRSPKERLELDAAGEPCLRVRQAPVEGQANEACIEFFARALRLPPSSVSIATGGKSRRKRIRIVSRSPREVAARLRALADESRGLPGGHLEF